MQKILLIFYFFILLLHQTRGQDNPATLLSDKETQLIYLRKRLNECQNKNIPETPKKFSRRANPKEIEKYKKENEELEQQLKEKQKEKKQLEIEIKHLKNDRDSLKVLLEKNQIKNDLLISTLDFYKEKIVFKDKLLIYSRTEITQLQEKINLIYSNWNRSLISYTFSHLKSSQKERMGDTILLPKRVILTISIYNEGIAQRFNIAADSIRSKIRMNFYRIDSGLSIDKKISTDTPIKKRGIINYPIVWKEKEGMWEFIVYYEDIVILKSPKFQYKKRNLKDEWL